jgi:hypothetical protein
MTQWRSDYTLKDGFGELEAATQVLSWSLPIDGAGGRDCSTLCRSVWSARFTVRQQSRHSSFEKRYLHSALASSS